MRELEVRERELELWLGHVVLAGHIAAALWAVWLVVSLLIGADEALLRAIAEILR
jgi:fatty acid desaturase